MRWKGTVSPEQSPFTCTRCGYTGKNISLGGGLVRCPICNDERKASGGT